MGIIEKVKEQATHLKENETVRGITEKVKDKVEDVQAKRKAHVLIEDLGRFNYAERTNRAVPGAHIEVARRLAELRMLEESGVVILREPHSAARWSSRWRDRQFGSEGSFVWNERVKTSRTGSL